MNLRKNIALTSIFVLSLVLGSCNTLGELAGVLTPIPTFLTGGDPQVTVSFLLTTTAEGWTATLPPSATPQPGEGIALKPEAGGTPAPTATATKTPPPTLTPLVFELPINVGPNIFPADVNPLTGLKVDDTALLDRRPMAIKITNFPRRVRPQSGISLADVVFEYYIENGLTRFIAIFYGTDAERVGPIRSGRFFDEHIVRMYNAIFAFASADARVLTPWLESDLVSRLVIPRPNNCPPLCRDINNPDYNNLYTNTADLTEYANGRGTRFELPGNRFQSLAPWGGAPAREIFTRYSRLDFNFWQYNADLGRYIRFQDVADDSGQGEEYEMHFDELTGQPVTTANLVLLLLPHEEFLKSSDTEIFKLHLQGAGRAYVFRDGQVWETTWARTSVDAPLQLFRAGPGAGSHFPLKPGNTFFQVIGSSSIIVENGDTWRFNFSLP